MKNKKLFLRIYVALVIIVFISIITLYLLGKKERVGYLSEFKINVDKTLELNGLDISETKQLFLIEDELDEAAVTNFVLTNTSITNYNYNFRIKYYDKVFRNSDIYGVYPNLDNLPEYIQSAKMDDNAGTPFGYLISSKIMDVEKIDSVNYVLKLKNNFIFACIILLILLLILYICFIYRNNIYKFFMKISDVLKINKILIFKIYVALVIIIFISIIILSLLGKKERVGYLSEFKINVDKTLETNDFNVEETKQLFTIDNELYYDAITNYIFTNDTITNYSYDFRIKYYDKVFRNSDIYGVYIDANKVIQDNNFIKEIKMGGNGSPFGNLISTKIIDIERIDIEYKLKLNRKLLNIVVICFIIISILVFFIKKIYKIVILLSINIFLYFLLIDFILPYFSLIKLNHSLNDIIFSSMFIIIAFYLLNRKISLTILFLLFNSFSFFIIEPIALSMQNTILLFNDIPTTYTTLVTVLPLHLKIILIIVTIIYFLLMLFMILISLFNLINIKKKYSILLIFFIITVSYVALFRNREIINWEVNFINNANKNGIIDTVNYKINYNRINTSDHTINEVKKSINILKEKEKNRDYSSLILQNINNKRDIFLIFLESFYDYSHFTNFFDNDPFPTEYRKWANSSAKIGPNSFHGSLDARISGLTASSPTVPKNQSEKIEYTLANLLLQNGYNTYALEEADVTYNLNNILPVIGFQNVIFNLGITNIDAYINTNINNMAKPIFVYGFTILGHTGWHIGNSINIQYNNKIFFNFFKPEDKNNLAETMESSVMTAIEVIKIRDVILKHSHNALIIFKHDHFYPHLIEIIKKSSIDKNIKNNFLNDSTPNPILIWDGTNGAYKAPNSLVAENIPMFIAVNAGVSNYKNSIISLLYKEDIDNIISTYHQYYKITNSTLILETNINKDLEIYKYENAQKVLSDDVLRGKRYYYDLIKDVDSKY